jgi:hypothetical protein
LNGMGILAKKGRLKMGFGFSDSLAKMKIFGRGLKKLNL